MKAFCVIYDIFALEMPRALTDSAKKKRLEKKEQKIEDATELPNCLKQATIEFLFRYGKEASEIIEFTGIPKSTVFKAIKRFKETGTCAPKPRSGRPEVAVTKLKIKQVRKMLWRDAEMPMTEIGNRLNIGRRSVARIVAKLKSRSYRMGRGQLLTGAQKQNRLLKAQRMMDFIDEKPDRLERILFTDEKIFPIGRYLNRQNHRQILSRRNKIKRWKTVGHTQFPKSIMVWAGVSGLGKTKLVFIEKNVKINSGYYQSEILKKRVKPAARRIFGRKKWWLQQDWAPAHGSRSTIAFCDRHFRGRYWGKDMWPSNSPDLNPLDFSIWALLMQRLGKRRYRSIKKLRSALKRAWKSISLPELKQIVRNLRKRLEACVSVNGDNFEHLLK